ncbi:MAG: transposase [Alphaproteobacteria bacterium]|nr:transposase [Alphaproteobacteria bacterium]
MPISKEILAVPRPKNTRVKDAKNGTYYVIARTCVYKNGKNVPKELGRVGRIINMQYVPDVVDKDEGIDIKSFGEVALYDKVGKDLLNDLLEQFEYKDALKLYCISLLRAAKPEIKNRDIETEYLTSYLSELYKNVSLSENTISAFLEEQGKHLRRFTSFMQKRIDKLGNSNVAIDGMLKSNTSDSNTMSEFSRKARIKGTEDISLIYAYDTERKEPVACYPYPGNMLDCSSFDDFVDNFKINHGFLIMDKGFATKNLRNKLVQKGIAYVLPIKANSTLINENKLDDNFEGFLEKIEGYVRYKKVKIGNLYYYSFHNKAIADEQSSSYMAKEVQNDTFSEETYKKKLSQFGLIVFESNKDLDPKSIYSAYQERWEIEMTFKLYKNILERNEVNVHGDYRLYSTEFINFLSTILVCRAKKLFVQKEIMNKHSFKQIIHYLSKCMKVRYCVANENKWKDNKRLKYIQEIVEILGI